MDLFFWIFFAGFFGSLFTAAFFFGGYQAIKDRLYNINAERDAEIVRLAKKLDTANMKNRRYQVELEKLYREQRQAHFEANAENVLIKERNPPSSN